MDIRTARNIATAVDMVPADWLRYTMEDIRKAFWRLDRSADRGHKGDRALAQKIWIFVGTD